MSNTENKRDRFVRIAEARTNKIISMIQLLGNCSNTSVYAYSDSDVEQIFGAIETATREAKKKYVKIDSTKNNKFTLK